MIIRLPHRDHHFISRLRSPLLNSPPTPARGNPLPHQSSRSRSSTNQKTPTISTSTLSQPHTKTNHVLLKLRHLRTNLWLHHPPRRNNRLPQSRFLRLVYPRTLPNATNPLDWFLRHCLVGRYSLPRHSCRRVRPRGCCLLLERCLLRFSGYGLVGISGLFRVGWWLGWGMAG